MSYFRVCLCCGSNLDPGEVCECKAAGSQQPTPAIRDYARASPRTVYHAGKRRAEPVMIRPINRKDPGARS